MDSFRDLQKICNRRQVLKQRENFLRRFNEVIVVLLTKQIVTFLLQIYLFLNQNVVLYIPLLKFLKFFMKCLMLVKIFLKISRLLFNVRIRKIFNKIYLKS